jgi:F-type H+-transporting ATPase subunit b
VISINIYVILMQMVNFCILLWLLNKYLVKPLSDFSEKRSKGIQQNIEAAEADKKESEKILTERKDHLRKAHQEAKQIRQDAEDATNKERTLVLQQAKNESEQLITNANKEITINYTNAKKVLKAQIGELAVNLSQKIIKKNIDEKSQETIIQDYIGAARN